MDDYITKPVQLDVLDDAIQRGIACLRGGPMLPLRGNGHESLDRGALDALRDLRRADKPDPVAELIDIFLKETPARLSEILAAVTQFDAGTLEAAAHSLRGCAASLGATRLADLCESLEDHAQSRSLQTAARLAEEAELEFQRLKAVLEEERSKG